MDHMTPLLQMCAGEGRGEEAALAWREKKSKVWDNVAAALNLCTRIYGRYTCKRLQEYSLSPTMECSVEMEIITFIMLQLLATNNRMMPPLCRVSCPDVR